MHLAGDEIQHNIISKSLKFAAYHAEKVRRGKAQNLTMNIPTIAAVFVLSRDYDCDSTSDDYDITIRLRYDDTTTNSTTTEVIEITI